MDVNIKMNMAGKLAMDSGDAEPNVCKGAFINYVSNLGECREVQKMAIFAYYYYYFCILWGEGVKKSPKICLKYLLTQLMNTPLPCMQELF